MNTLYFIIALTLFIIDIALDMPPRHTVFSSNFAYSFIYFSIQLYMSEVLLHYYYLSLVSIDRLVESRIFLSLFSRDPTLRA